jgi:AcrR family transcriptional regulator
MERILDAASHVFADAGYDASTTEAIAERAGTSIGSVYQFFPNKLAIFNAIAVRYVERVRELFGSFVAPRGPLPRGSGSTPWFDLLDRAIDAFAAFHKSEPGFRAILLNWRVSADMVLANDDVNRELAKRTEQVIAPLAPALSPARRALVATMIIETVSAMLILSARRGSAIGDAIIVETKTMLRRYLEPVVTEHAAPTEESARPTKSGARTKKR